MEFIHPRNTSQAASDGGSELPLNVVSVVESPRAER